MQSIKLALVAAAAATLLSPAMAQGVSYNLGVTTANTDDVRGDDFRPSLNLGADYDFGNGAYTGAAFTTGKYAEGAKERGEIVLSAGYGQELSNGFFYDLNASRYIRSKTDTNYNEMGLTVGYGPVAFAYYKGFDTDGFISKSDSYEVMYIYGLTDALEAGLTVTKVRDDDKNWSSSLDYELAFSYDLGDNMTATAAINKAKPKFVLGLSKSF